MKQHITAEQLNQLSDKGKERLREWEISKNYTFDVWDSVREVKVAYEPKLLSIGQMSEFLDDHWDGETEIESGGGNWYVNHRHWDHKTGLISEEELADALWEACKEILDTTE